MLQYQLYQNKSAIAGAANKWYPRIVSSETIDLSGLSKHMSMHNTPFSKGVITGILTDMVSCIKELLLEGKNVKIDDLAIFSIGIEAKGVDNVDDFSVASCVKAVKMNALATGELSRKSINLEASLKEKSTYVSPKSSGSASAETVGGDDTDPTDTDPTTDPTGTDTGSDDSGSGTDSGSGSDSGSGTDGGSTDTGKSDTDTGSGDGEGDGEGDGGSEDEQP